MRRERSAAPAPAKGLTLVELVVVVAIAAILTSIAAPSLTQTFESMRARSAGTDLYVSLARVRSEAIKRNTSVTLSPKEGGWAHGWKIADPANPDGNPLIEDHEALTNLSVAGPASVVYQSSGRVQGATPPSFQISGSHSESTRCVGVTLSGEPQVRTGPC